jgi:alkylation response protein AidB-like acyl-CoA dehydrogenase
MTGTTMDPRAATADDVLERVRALVPTITARAAEIEAARRIPRDLLDELIDAGAFRVLLTPTVGGLGADLAAGMRVVETLARADASVGWTVMIGAGAWCDVAGLSRASFESLYADRPDAIVAGAINPTGSITPVEDGYRVNGRWGFASGCEHATWLVGNCVEGFDDNGPQLRIAVLRPDQVVIEDTWTVLGMSGTGSHHFRADDVVVPAERTIPIMTAEPCIDDTIVRIPVPALLSLLLASVAIGTAQGAWDDIVDLAADKVPLFAGRPLAATPSFHVELAEVDTTIRAARTLLYETADLAWATAAADELTIEQRARIRATAVWATDTAVDVVTRAYRLGGGGAVYADSVLQRRLRDIHALSQHFLVRRDTLTTAGAVLAGQALDVPIF